MSFETYRQIHELLASLQRFDCPEDAQDFVGKNGLYFFYQKGERFKCNAGSWDRIVRVGINKADGRLLERIKDHYLGRGNGIRDHLEPALSNTNPDWKGKWRQTKKALVTDYIRENFCFRVISVRSLHQARRWERKVISTIAPYSIQFASPCWVGRKASNPRVKGYGLYISHHAVAFEHEFRGADMEEFTAIVQRERDKQERILQCR